MTEELVNITTREVASIARVDTSTVRKWVEQGHLTPTITTPGGHYRFNRADVLTQLAGTKAARS